MAPTSQSAKAMGSKPKGRSTAPTKKGTKRKPAKTKTLGTKKVAQRKNGKGKAKKKKSTRKKKGDSQFGKTQLYCSPPLSELLKSGASNNGKPFLVSLTRPEAVKELWAYVRANALKDPQDGRRILCNAAMTRTFGVSTLSVLEVSAALSKHLFKTAEEALAYSQSVQRPHAVPSPKVAEPVKPSPYSLIKPATPVLSTEPTQEEQVYASKAFQDLILSAVKAKRNQKGSPTNASSSLFSASPTSSSSLPIGIGTNQCVMTPLTALRWLGQYIKVYNLQNSETRTITCNERLKKLLQVDTFPVSRAKALLAPHLSSSPPSGFSTTLVSHSALDLRSAVPFNLDTSATSIGRPSTTGEQIAHDTKVRDFHEVKTEKARSPQNYTAGTDSEYLPAKTVLEAALPEWLSSTSGLDSTPAPEQSAGQIQYASELPSREAVQREDHTKLCVVCLEKPPNACFVHGKDGHQVCCLKCAKELKRKRQPCPVCRKNIDIVIENFSA